MAYPSISNGTARPELNPAALFQTASTQEKSADANFGNALEKAQQPETPRERQPERPRQASQQPRERSTETSQEPSPAKPSEAAQKKPESGEQESIGDSTKAPGDEDSKAIATAEPPAGLPAEIAAIVAALAAAAGKNGNDTTKAELLPDVPASKLAAGIADLLAGHNGKGNAKSDAALAAVSGKAAPEVNFGAEPRDKAIAQQILNLAAQSGAGKNPAEQLLQGMRGEGMPGTQAANMLYSPRAEGLQQTAQLPQLPVATAAGQRAWAAEVGNQVAWMLGRNESKAELVLTPPSLGKLGVSIHVNGDQTTAHFVAASQAARDALEQALPRLREILQQSGINLGQTNVSTSGDQRAHDGQEGSGRWRHGATSETDGVTATSTQPAALAAWARGGNGVIDTFA